MSSAIIVASRYAIPPLDQYAPGFRHIQEFIAALSSAATWPLAAFAQQPVRMRRVGVLMSPRENDIEGQTRASIVSAARLGAASSTTAAKQARMVIDALPLASVNFP
jgi:hypothetical protein